MFGLVFAVLAWAFILTGALFVVAGAIGIYRFPDFYSRLHGAGVTDTFGADLMVTGLIFETLVMFDLADSWSVVAKLFFIGAFFFFTSPTSTHAIAQAAYVAGLKPFLHPIAKQDATDAEDFRDAAEGKDAS